MATKTRTADPRELIKQKIIAEGRKLSWLADQTGIKYHSLYSIIINQQWPLSQENLKKINKALETNYQLHDAA